MKRKLLTATAFALLIAGLTMLIAPRIFNRVGEQIAHTTIEDFKTLKSKATFDEPTEKKNSSEDSLSNIYSTAKPSKSGCNPVRQIEDEENYINNSEISDSVTNVENM